MAETLLLLCLQMESVLPDCRWVIYLPLAEWRQHQVETLSRPEQRGHEKGAPWASTPERSTACSSAWSDKDGGGGLRWGLWDGGVRGRVRITCDGADLSQMEMECSVISWHVVTLDKVSPTDAHSTEMPSQEHFVDRREDMSTGDRDRRQTLRNNFIPPNMLEDSSTSPGNPNGILTASASELSGFNWSAAVSYQLPLLSRKTSSDKGHFLFRGYISVFHTGSWL